MIQQGDQQGSEGNYTRDIFENRPSLSQEASIGAVPGIHLNLPVFEGPMDLLLYLIKREEVDIFDIPISLIADEYLRSLEAMGQQNLEVGGEFLVMAATLLSIKARMLLPRPSGENGESSEEDPRRDLVERILEYKAFKESAELFRQLEESQSNRFWRGSSFWAEELSAEIEPSLQDVTLYDLLTAFKLAMDRLQSEKPHYAVTVPSENVDQRMEALRNRLRDRSRITFSALVKELTTRFSIVVTFLAILELVRLGEISLKGMVENDFLMVARNVAR